MHKGFTEPHVLLASSNPQKLIRNLRGILSQDELAKIQVEVDKNVSELFLLGMSHYNFALKIHKLEWRQIVSRYYYAAYNVKRALQLKDSGSFATDVSDHKNVDDLPSALANRAYYSQKLKNLRDDRNLADYSHLAKEDDLLIAVNDVKVLVSEFIRDAKIYFNEDNINL